MGAGGAPHPYVDINICRALPFTKSVALGFALSTAWAAILVSSGPQLNVGAGGGLAGAGEA